MRTAAKQKGMTAIGWLLTIVIIGFVSMIMVKLVPVYFGRLNVISVMNTLENEAGVGTMSSAEIIERIGRRLEMNNVQDISKDNIYISQANGLRIIELDYQVRRTLLGNHDIIISYISRIEVPAQ